MSLLECLTGSEKLEWESQYAKGSESAGESGKGIVFVFGPWRDQGPSVRVGGWGNGVSLAGTLCGLCIDFVLLGSWEGGRGFGVGAGAVDEN